MGRWEEGAGGMEGVDAEAGSPSCGPLCAAGPEGRCLDAGRTPGSCLSSAGTLGGS